jgi:mRNA interferase RelE/StbE
VAYTVQFTSAADRALRNLDLPVQRRLVQAAERLAQHPRPPGVKRLKGGEEYWRIRVGDYRIIYQIRDRQLLVVIVGMGHRGDVYR